MFSYFEHQIPSTSGHTKTEIYWTGLIMRYTVPLMEPVASQPRTLQIWFYSLQPNSPRTLMVPLFLWTMLGAHCDLLRGSYWIPFVVECLLFALPDRLLLTMFGEVQTIFIPQELEVTCSTSLVWNKSMTIGFVDRNDRLLIIVQANCDVKARSRSCRWRKAIIYLL